MRYYIKMILRGNTRDLPTNGLSDILSFAGKKSDYVGPSIKMENNVIRKFEYLAVPVIMVAQGHPPQFL